MLLERQFRGLCQLFFLGFILRLIIQHLEDCEPVWIYDMLQKYIPEEPSASHDVGHELQACIYKTP